MNQLRICTWNINLGLERKTILKSLSGPADFKILDILVLQEASEDKVEDAKLIANCLGKDYDFKQAYIQTPDFKLYSTKRELKGITQSSAIIWNKKRIKISSLDTLILPPYGNDNLSAYSKAILKISSTQQRLALVAQGRFLNKTFRLYVVHFDVFGPVGKIKQLEAIINDNRQKASANFEILAGDFNTFKFFKRPKWAKLQQYIESEGFIELTTNI